jgi:ADP-heptose:LPS heptosyltransferase
LEVLRHNPNIDEFWFQHTEEVPNEELGPFWDKIKQGFDKFIQLNGSIEIKCIAIQGKDRWVANDPTGIHRELRRKRYNLNYYETNIREAGYEPIAPCKGELYFSRTERMLMEDFFRAKIKDRFSVLWCLTSSSNNRLYPWSEHAIVEFLSEHKDAVCITTGDEMTQALEFIHPRVFPKSGIWNIRQALLACSMVDLVVTIDTGIMHAAGCFDDVGKIVLHAATTPENLTKHFLNCVDLMAYDCVCYPCHSLLYRFKAVCPIGETGASMCMEMIKPSTVLMEMDEFYHRWKNDSYRNESLSRITLG